MGQLLHPGAVSVHDVNIQVPVLQGCEYDLLSVGREHTLSCIDAESREATEVRPVGPRAVDVERIKPPDVALRWVRPRRTVLLERLARGEKDAAVAIHEVAARRFPLPVRHAPDTRAIDVHHVL